MSRVLTIKEAAVFLQVSPKSVQIALHGGKLPGAKVGREWRLSETALLDHLNGRQNGHAPNGPAEDARKE
jgi:excisionase family DNA binding protein